MKYNRLLILLAALLQCSIAVHAELADLFTNANAIAKMAPLRRPSIIFIQCHGLAIGDLSCYGQTNFQTPNLDRLAAAGIRFTRYQGGADSPATTAMLLSGQATARAPGNQNLAQQLQINGYSTGFIGEWMFDREPWRWGFSEFAGFFTDAEAQNYYAENIWRYPHIIYDEVSQATKKNLEPEMLYHNTGGKKGQYLPELLVTAMVNFIRINTPDSVNHFRPFFLFATLPAPRSATTGADVFPVPSDAPFTGDPWPQAAKNRAALITRLDSGIGRLVEGLKKAGLTNNVMILFSSSSAPEPFAKTNMSFLLPRDNFRNPTNAAPQLLPMIVRWPTQVPAGQVSDHAWTAADFAATALELATLKPTTNFTGQSVLPVMQGRPASKASETKR